MSHRVFISHSEADNALARDICHRIERCGVQCWIAPRDVLVGENYLERIGDAIEQSAALVVVLSRHTNHSVYVRREVEYACSAKIPIFPIRAEKFELSRDLKFAISISHRVDAFGAGRTRAVEQFAQAVVRKVHRGKGVAPLPEDVRELVRLIGPGGMDFIRQWKRMDQSGASLAWSWEAFFGGAFWPFYRGMIGLGALLVTVLVIMMLLGGAIGGGSEGALGGLLGGWIIAALFAGLTGSAALRRAVRRMAAEGGRPSGPRKLAAAAAATAAVTAALLGSLFALPGPAAAPVSLARGGGDGPAADPKSLEARKEARRKAFNDTRRAEEERKQRELEILGTGYIVGRIDQAEAEMEARRAEQAQSAGNAASPALDPTLAMTNGM